MVRHMRFLEETFITYSTDIRTLALATMYKLVFLQVTRMTACFVTHITSIRTLATMYTPV